jgi:hypothetical protein
MTMFGGHQSIIDRYNQSINQSMVLMVIMMMMMVVVMGLRLLVQEVLWLVKGRRPSPHGR